MIPENMLQIIGMSVTQLEKSQLKTTVPQMRSGDTVRVRQKVKEGDKERISAFEGLVIAMKHGRGITGTFTVRKIVDGIGVERVFPLHSPRITQIEILRRFKVRRSKIYFVREKSASQIRKKLREITKPTKKIAKKTVTEE